MMPYVARYKKQVCIAIAALLGASGSLLSVPYFIGQLIDRLSAGRSDFSLGPILWWLVFFIALYAVSTALRAYMVTWVGERVIADLRKRIYGHLLTLSYEFFEARSTGEILSRISNDITALQVLISIVLVIGLRSIVQLVGALVMMLLTDWRLSLIAIVISPAIGAITRVLGRRVRARSSINRDREAEIVAQLEESINGIETIKAFTVETLEQSRFDQQVEACFQTAEKLIRARAEILMVVVFLLMVACGIIGAVALHQLMAEEVSGGTIGQVLIYLSVAGFSVLGLADIHGETKKAVGATERLFGLLDEKPELRPVAQLQNIPDGKGAVEFIHVTFNYPGRPHAQILEDFSLSVKAGEIVALTGPSGAGKTTLFRLLLSFYVPQRGVVTLDGMDVSKLDAVTLRREISIVAQEPLIFSGTAMENIRLGRPDATDQEVEQAAELAQANGFIRNLPAGYQTPLGIKGHQLSSGQRQRLAIARAIVRQPRLMLLDEASSFLDVESEALLHEALVPFLRERTTLIVTHRPAVLKYADRVVALNLGRIVVHKTGNAEFSSYSI